MTLLRSCVVVSTMVALISSSPAQEPLQPGELLRELEALKEERAQRMTGVRQDAVRALRDAASSGSSAVDFYQQTVRDLDFAGQDRESTKFREWRDNNEGKLRDKTFQRAIQLHLNYLLLTIRRANDEELDTLVGPLVTHATELLEDTGDEVRRHRELLGEELGRSIFVRRYGLQPWFSDLKDWEMNPGNANGIFEKNILPVLREAKDARVLNYWDQRIQRESENALSGGAFAKQQFQEENLPNLQMRRTQELFELDRGAEGVRAMFEILRANPQHPSFNAWADQLKQRVEAMQPAPAAEADAVEEETPAAE